MENIKAFADAVQKAKPSGAKGTFINRIAISSTMGPGVKVEPASLFVAGWQLVSAKSLPAKGRNEFVPGACSARDNVFWRRWPP